MFEQYRKEGKIFTYVNHYGKCYSYLPTKNKKGCGKGRKRLQRVVVKSRNSVDNLTWVNHVG